VLGPGNDEDMSLSLSSNTSKKSSSSSLSSNSKKTVDSFAGQDAAMIASLAKKLDDLEETWVCYASTTGKEDDATFIAKQIKELQAFISEHQEHLGVQMMSATSGALLTSCLASEEGLFPERILPMLTAKAERDQCSVLSVYKELSQWTDATIKATGTQTEDLLYEVCNIELNVHQEWLATGANTRSENDNSKNKSGPLVPKKKPEEWERARASLFKANSLALDKESRAEFDAQKKKDRRSQTLQKARSKPAGWMSSATNNDSTISKKGGKKEKDKGDY